MIPLRDNVPSRGRPVTGLVIIAVTAIVFLYEQSLSQSSLIEFFRTYGLVPARFTGADALGVPPGPRLLGLASAMFLHAGWLHFLGNMWFLWIFGDNVEDHLGHRRFLVFYLLSGVAAGLAQVLANPSSQLPMVGASGAVAGVMGAYFILYPRARILTLLPIIFFLTLVEVPAIFFLGIWFVIQFFSGAMTSMARVEGGVAFWAHAGGFVAGILFLGLLGGWRRPQPPAARWSRPFTSGWRG
ncbi:MAG: rhomboid family intramembrane serine protease [Candidatus Eisenbacteria bacterium]|nr:rhomboid family intramembrane serine protease [Candidatus Eisenbacteria bacterium]